MQDSEKSYKEVLDYLRTKYRKNILNRKEVAIELDVTPNTLSAHIQNGLPVPKFYRKGNSSNATYAFKIIDIARFLAD